MRYNKKLAWLFGCLFVFVASAQNTQMKVGNNPYTLSSPTAVLELESTTKGFLPPRMTSVSMNSISSPAQGLVVYCTDCTQGKALYVYNGTSWIPAIAFDATTGSKGVVQLAGDLTGTAASPTIVTTDAVVTGKKLTGFVSSTGTISATDSVLSAFNKIEGNKSASITQDSGSTVKYPTVKAVQDYVAIGPEYGIQELPATKTLPTNLSTEVLSFTLPSAGVWEITWQTNIEGSVGSSSNIVRAWVAEASGAVIPNSSQRLHYASSGSLSNVGTNTFRIQTSGSQVLKLMAHALFGCAVYAGTAQSTDFRTNVVYKKISDLPVSYLAIPLTGFVATPGTVSATDTVLQAIQKLASNTATTPAGVVSSYSGPTLPAGYLWCDGAAFSRTTYATLFSVISTTYGVGDGSTTFNVPDYRGLFLRGRNDFGSGARTDANKDPDTRALGNIQADDNKAHTHGVEAYYDSTVSATGKITATAAANTNIRTQTTDSSGGAESRPRNIAVSYIIKF